MLPKTIAEIQWWQVKESAEKSWFPPCQDASWSVRALQRLWPRFTWEKIPIKRLILALCLWIQEDISPYVYCLPSQDITLRHSCLANWNFWNGGNPRHQALFESCLPLPMEIWTGKTGLSHISPFPLSAHVSGTPVCTDSMDSSDVTTAFCETLVTNVCHYPLLWHHLHLLNVVPREDFHWIHKCFNWRIVQGNFLNWKCCWCLGNLLRTISSAEFPLNHWLPSVFDWSLRSISLRNLSLQ